jgi:hypothetical protein
MAFELRCPGCRAKLRLPDAPEEGSEIECPKCGQVFAAEAASVGAARGGDGAGTTRKKPASDAPAKSKKRKEPAPGGTPRRRLLKKRKSNPYVLYGAIGGGVLLLGIFIGAIVWFFNRQSASQEMMLYLPDDCDEVWGINIGHLQKYPEFYKTCEAGFANTGFKRAADMFSKALGQETNDTITYVVQGTGQGVAATVLRTKEEFDPGMLARMPSAQKGTRNGVDYYVIPGSQIQELGYGELIKIFAPTPRIVVFTRGDTPESKFDAMLSGHEGNKEATPGVRAGQLAKQVVRGTAWRFMLYGRSVTKLPPPNIQPSAGSESEDDQLRKEIADIVANAQGCGFKASIGSRDVRGEFVVWYKDSDEANGMLKKWREKDWVQDEEKDPPKFFGALASKSGGGKTAKNVIRDGLSFRQSGETFSVRTAMEVNLIKGSIVSIVNSVLAGSGGGAQNRMGFPMQPGGGGGPPPNPRRRRLLFLRKTSRAPTMRE